jgi:succinate dehydrogenase / fumarate reductase, iron-sulfur subunit
MTKTFTLKIYRGTPQKQYWEEFELPLKHSMNVISALMEIQKNPVNKAGVTVAPVVWEDGCLEEVCGSCSMLINGKPSQACTALIDPIIEKTKSNTITLAPFTKFPLVRDLMVDRSVMFENLKKVSAWVDVDGYYDKGEGPNISPQKQEVMYTLSTCMTCGCCSESCPQVNEHSKFIGPAPISQVRLFNAHPTGNTQKSKRLQALMEEGGISDCGNAQNCVRVCPKNIPLTDSIAAMGKDVIKESFSSIFNLNDRKD